MDNLYTIFMALPGLCLLGAIILQKEMAVWLAVVTVSGALVIHQDHDIWEALLLFCVFNFLSLMVAYIHHKRTYNLLPLLMGITYCIEIVLAFIHLLIYSNTQELVLGIGIATGLIGISQLIAVFVMDDSKGALCDIFSDMRRFANRGLCSISYYKNRGGRQ